MQKEKESQENWCRLGKVVVSGRTFPPEVWKDNKLDGARPATDFRKKRK